MRPSGDRVERNASNAGAAVRPQLRIVHLMLWTLCSAVFLAVMRMEMQYHRDDTPFVLSEAQRVMNVIQGVIAGAVAMGIVVLVYDRIRGKQPLLRDPGHWLLLGAAVTYLAGMPLILMASILDRSEQVDTRIFLAFGMNYAASAAIYLIALASRQEIGWKAFYSAFALEHLVQSLTFIGLWTSRFSLTTYSILSGLAGFGNIALAGWLLIFLCIDLASGRMRDWLHWTGVVTCAANRGAYLLWWASVWVVAT